MRINRFTGNLKPLADWIKRITDGKNDIDSITEIIDKSCVRLVFTFKKSNKEKINSEQWTDILSK